MRKLLLLAAMAIAAMALTAPNAFAQEEPVEVVNEATSDHCDIVAQNCVVHAESVSESEIVEHVLGHEEHASSCHDHFEAVLDEDGSGTIYDQILSGGGCTQQACDSTSELDWPITQSGETGLGTGHMTVRFCLEDVGGGDEIHCDAEVDITEAPGHEYEFSLTNFHCPVVPGIAEATITGHWNLENGDHDAIEIEHDVPH